MSKIKFDNNRGDSLIKDLFAQADALSEQAKQFEGCSFFGEWPGSHYLRQASLLREAAYEILKGKGGRWFKALGG